MSAAHTISASTPDTAGRGGGRTALAGAKEVTALQGTLNGLFGLVAARRPREVVVADADRALTYESAESSSDRLASALLRCGVQLGDPLLVHCSDRAQGLVAQLAVLKLGGVCVPVPHGADDASLARIADLSGATLVLGSAATRERWSLPVVVLDDERTWAKIKPFRTDGSLPRSGPADVAYLLPEFGSDGGVTGHLVDHTAWLFAVNARLRRAGRPARGVTVGQGVGGARDLAAMWWAIAAGGRLQGPRPPGTGEAAPRLHGSGTAAVYGADEYEAVLAAARPGAGKRSGTVLVTGGPLPAGLVERHAELLPFTRLLAEFSPRDGAMPWTAADCTADARKAAGRTVMGAAVPRVRVTVRDADGGILPPGGTGQIWAAGTAMPFDRLCDGCHELAASHRGSLTNSGYTGRWTASGSLEVLGRTGPHAHAGRSRAGHREDTGLDRVAGVPLRQLSWH
ncbi:AMP-binding protein [Streptomyces albus]|uniref:AMP-binding protein n=1 Tax=Streptomyces albus TaxID=1888 RepID=UPI0004C5DAE4|nr:AMP-binding protein [Streptomyces albus]